MSTYSMTSKNYNTKKKFHFPWKFLLSFLFQKKKKKEKERKKLEHPMKIFIYDVNCKPNEAIWHYYWNLKPDDLEKKNPYTYVHERKKKTQVKTAKTSRISSESLNIVSYFRCRKWRSDITLRQLAKR